MEILKQGKQINMAIVYGFSVNYGTGMTRIMKLTLDFEKSYDVRAVENEVTLIELINFMVAVLSK